MSEVESAIRVRHASPVVVHVVYIMYYVSYYPHTSRDAPVPFSKQRKKSVNADSAKRSRNPPLVRYAASCTYRLLVTNTHTKVSTCGGK